MLDTVILKGHSVAVELYRAIEFIGLSHDNEILMTKAGIRVMFQSGRTYTSIPPHKGKAHAEQIQQMQPEWCTASPVWTVTAHTLEKPAEH